MVRYPSLLAVALMVSLVSPMLPQTQAIDFGSIVSSLATDLLKGLWRTGEIILLDDKYCTYRVKPTLSSEKGRRVQFIGSLTCPGWTTIRGESRTVSQSAVVNQAVEDFLTKALKAGLITQAQADSVNPPNV